MKHAFDVYTCCVPNCPICRNNNDKRIAAEREERMKKNPVNLLPILGIVIDLPYIPE